MQRQRVPHRPFLIGGVVAAAACAAVTLAASSPGGGAAVSFAGDVQPIFDRKCTACHPVSYPYLDLRRGRSYHDLVRVQSETAPAFHRVLPGRPELSYLLTHPPDPSLHDLLSSADRRTIATWIREGARAN